MLKKLVQDKCGAAAAEYALILSIGGIAIGAAALGLGANIAAGVGSASKIIYNTRHAIASNGGAASAGQGKGNNGGNGLATAPGQNPSSGNGNSNGNQTPGSSPSSPPGKKK